MTTKRFVLFKDGETIIDNEPVADDGGKQIYWTVEYTQKVKLVELLNELHEENEQLLSDKEHLMGYLIRFRSFDDDDIDYVMNRASNREYGKQYYDMKEEDW